MKEPCTQTVCESAHSLSRGNCGYAYNDFCDVKIRAGTGYTVLPAIFPAVEGIILTCILKKKLVQKT